MKKLLLVVLLLISQFALAQKLTYREQAENAYAQKDYITAAYYYDKVLQNKTVTTHGTVPYFSTRQDKHPLPADSAYITYRLAESYRLYQDFFQAEKWYKEITNTYEATYPLGRLWYAVCLRSNGHPDEAIEQAKLFIDKNKANQQYADMGERELKNDLFAKNQSGISSTIVATKMGGNMNGDGGDFGLNINNGHYWYSSSRSIRGDTKHMSRIYWGGEDSTGIKKRVSLVSDSKADLQYGTPSLDASGKTMYLTEWHTETGNREAAIFISRLVGQKWSDPQKLNNNVNVAQYNAMQPFVTNDGKHLYYASNKPGGFGGTDIWVSDLNAEGMPVNATNLGADVNSPEDEQAPFYNEAEHKLVYSSKGFVGMGGFDLFESIDTNSHWTAPKNLGFPFNSTKDDVYYFPDDKDPNIFYISSDRQSECCLNLFRVDINGPKHMNEPLFILSGIVINCADSEPLEGVKVTLLDSTSKQTLSYVSNEVGMYKFNVPVNHYYKIKLEKEDYFTRVFPIPLVPSVQKDTLYAPAICEQEYQINVPIVIKNILYDFNKYTLKPESKEVLNDLIGILRDNPKITVELSSHTDIIGTEDFNRKLSLRRAQSCVDYIIKRGHISKRRITAMGYGASHPLAPNTLPNGEDNPEGRALNRRTEFKVLTNK